MKVIKLLGFFLLLGAAYLLLWPIDMELVSYTPPKAPGLVGGLRTKPEHAGGKANPAAGW